MKVLIVALFTVGAFVNGQVETTEEMRKEMERSPCYPLMKQFRAFHDICDEFTSPLYTTEQLDEVLTELFEKTKQMYPNEEGLQKDGYVSIMKKQLCALEKLGVIDPQTKSIDAEKFVQRFDIITDKKAKADMIKVSRDCIAEQSAGELKFAYQDFCMQHKSAEICTPSMQ